MQRRAVGRGIAVVVLALALGIAGAPPAAAQEPGLVERSMEWLLGLADSLSLSSVWEALDLLDQGAGLDPNGKPVVIVEPPPVGEIR